MKRLVIVATAAAWLGGCVFVQACGSSNSGKNCSDVCAKVGQCLTPDDEQSCLQDCPGMKPIFRSSAWDNAVACFMDTPCGPDFSPDKCLMQSGLNEPDSVLDAMIDTLCAKNHECDSQVDVEQCKTEFLSEPDSKALKAFTDSVLNCTGSCVSGKDCQELTQIYDVIGVCLCSCNAFMYCIDY
ncbi:MAG TPA: hypothetical protein VM425_14565 [Myxococcota bacterium]|nr:hypothetical protein [Myxococcota bacterium]